LIRADNATVRRRCKDALREGNSLRDQLRLTQEALSGSQAACTRLEKHVRELEEKLRKAHTERSQNGQELAVARTQLAALRERQERDDTRAAAEGQAAAARSMAAAERCESAERERDELRAEQARTQEALAVARAELRALEALGKRTDEETVGEARGDRERMRAQCAALGVELNQAFAEVDKLKTTGGEARAELASARDENRALRELTKRLRDAVRQLQAHGARAASAAAEQGARAAEAERAHSATREELAVARTELASLFDRLQRDDARAAAEGQAAAVRSTAAAKRCESAERERDELRAELARTQEALAVARTELRGLEAARAAADTAMSTERRLLVGRAESAENRAVELEAAREAAMCERAAAVDELASASAEARAQATLLAETQAQLAELRAMLREQKGCAARPRSARDRARSHRYRACELCVSGCATARSALVARVEYSEERCKTIAHGAAAEGLRMLGHSLQGHWPASWVHALGGPAEIEETSEMEGPFETPGADGWGATATGGGLFDGADEPADEYAGAAEWSRPRGARRCDGVRRDGTPCSPDTRRTELRTESSSA